MTKITGDHLTRSAPCLRAGNPASISSCTIGEPTTPVRADDARPRPWLDNVIVIDDDLGRCSGGGTARPEFERLLAAICSGDAACVPRGLAPRPQRARLAHPSGVLCPGLQIWRRYAWDYLDGIVPNAAPPAYDRVGAR